MTVHKDIEQAGRAPAWTDEELHDPHANRAKQEKVRRMFASIARSYDLNNRLHSLWRDQAWRRHAVRCAAPRPSDHVLDVACGTGDLTQAFADAGASRVVGLDYTPEMLEIAEHKRTRSPAKDRIEYVQGDAQHLQFRDGEFDIVSIAFGIRNVQQPAAALNEFRRVLRPAGRLVVLEFSEPAFPPMRWFNSLYCRSIMPRTATLISGDKSGAYKYLPKSVQSFHSVGSMRALLRDAGFVEMRSDSLTFGICHCHSARTP